MILKIRDIFLNQISESEIEEIRKNFYELGKG